MRHGYRRRFAAEEGRESRRGRAAFARPLNTRPRKSSPASSHDKDLCKRSWRSACRRSYRLQGFEDLEEARAETTTQWPSVVSRQLSNEDENAGAEWGIWKDDFESGTETTASSIASSDELEERSNSSDSDDSVVRRPKATRWEEAVARAVQAAAAYRALAPPHQEVSEEPCVPAAPPPAGIPQLPKSPASRQSFVNPGQPSCPQTHDQVISLSSPGTDCLPSCWEKQRRGEAVVNHCTEEYKAVTRYFLQTVGHSDYHVSQLTRLQNTDVYMRYLAQRGCARQGDETVMFHGCKSQGNEDGIRANGFQITRCISGGTNYGTWFAYNASYSDAGYAFPDSAGLVHIFVCVVCYTEVVRDDITMRVVGQDCAYPMWMLTYKRPPPPPPPRPIFQPTPPVSLGIHKRRLARVPGSKKRTGRLGPSYFFEVRGGQWVQVPAIAASR
jgi:hypothetical protein